MKELRIELLGKGDDLVLLDAHPSNWFENLSDREILEIPIAHARLALAENPVRAAGLQRPAGRRAEKICDEPAGRKTGKGFSFVPCWVYHHQTFGTNSMAIRFAIIACAVASLTGSALSADAG